MARDLSRSRAILIGNGTFTDREKIPDVPAHGCLEAMFDLLTSDLCGWPRDRISLFEDLPNLADLARNLVRAVREAEDVLLVYYVGHGMLTARGDLVLALRDTEADPEVLPHTAMPYASLASILRGSTAETKLVILDCCYAETANQATFGTQSAGLTDVYPVDGLYFIGASKRWEKAGFPLLGKLTYFTAAFIDTVRTGIQGKPPQLTIGQIFIELRARLVRAGLPEPAASGARGAHAWLFARNAAPSAAHRDLHQEEIARLQQQNAAAEARERALQAAVAERTAEVERLLRLFQESAPSADDAPGREWYVAMRRRIAEHSDGTTINGRDESALDALTTALERLENNTNFKMVEFSPSGAVVWTISLDACGTPTAHYIPVADAPAAGPTDFYHRQLAPMLEGRLLLVGVTTLSYPRDVVQVLREEQGVSVYSCVAPLEDLIKTVIRASPLRTFYELLVMRQKAAGRITLVPHPLFPPGAVSGYSTDLVVRCAPTDEHGTAFAVVARQPGAGGQGTQLRMHPIEVQSAAIMPGTYEVRAVLMRPGHVNFQGLPVRLERDQRKLQDIVRTTPGKLRAARGTHLVCMLEVTGGAEPLEQRVKRLEALIDTAEASGRLLKVSLVTYGPHAVDRNGTEDPAMTLSWATSSHLAKLKLQEVQEAKARQARDWKLRDVPETEYGRAAQLECALREVNSRLTARDGSPVLVTAGARPPHPSRVDLATEIIPCPNMVRWQDELSRLQLRLPELRFGALFGPDAVGEIWRDLGRDAHGDLEVVDLPEFATQLGLRDPVQAVPFPIIG